MKKCVVIYNKKSGKIKNSEFEDNLYSIISKYGYELKIITTKKKGDGTNIMLNLDDDIDLVISAGGDGTFNEVIKGNYLRKNKLLISELPLGTTNDVASMYGLTGNYKKDIDLIMNGTKKNIDIILINDTPFVYCAAFGNFVNTTFDTPKGWKEKFGRMAYIFYIFTKITKKIKLHHIKYKINNKNYEGIYSYIFVTNSSRIGGLDNIFNDVKLDDNKFEVLLCKTNNKAEILKSLYHIKNKGAADAPHCKYFKTSSFDIIFDKDVKSSWCLDGEEYKDYSKEFKFCVNKDIYILLPKNNINKLFDK